METKDFTQHMTVTQDQKSQSQFTPASAIEMLKHGNERFVQNKALARDHLSQVKQTSTGQFPFAVVLSCIDSRVPAELVFDQGIGDIFNVRIAGNFVNDDILGSLEFACKLAGSKVVVVLGHTSCGAIKGACDNAELGNLTQMLDKIQPAVSAVETKTGTERSSSNATFVNHVVEENVRMAIEDIKANSSVLNDMHENREIDVVGAIYDVSTGKVRFLQELS